MATKDWKKTGKKFEYKNKDKDAILWFTIVPGKEVYYVNIAYFSGGIWKRGITKRFKTKTEALKYARSYMRKN